MADAAPEASSAPSAAVAVPLSAKAPSERDDGPAHPGTPPVGADGAPAGRKDDAEERKRREEEEGRKKRDADDGKKSGGFHLHPRIHEALKATEHAVVEGARAVKHGAEVATVAVVYGAGVAGEAVVHGVGVASEKTVESAEVARVHVVRWSREAATAVSDWSASTYIRTKAVVLNMTGPARAVGEPDEDLLVWKKCRRCQLQFDPANEDDKCRYHPARWECGSGEPFALRHRKGSASSCDDECDGRFPCCGARQKRNSADSSGCRAAECHVPE